VKRFSRATAEAPTALRALDIAERLIQTRGYNGFSYADVAAELGVTKAALHFHFATKEQLGIRLVERYSERFEQALAGIAGGRARPLAKLEAYTELYAETLRGKRMCLCGMLAAELETLPQSMRDALRKFFDLNEQWLANVLAAGRKSGELNFDGPPERTASALVATLEGAMLLARSYDKVDRFETSARIALRGLGSNAAP
jgi:TetR/AcrR family transcriptional repressor of nem operon